MPKTGDVHVAAMQRSLIDLDRQLDRAVELTALGEREQSNEICRQYLSGLDDRFRGDFKNIPIDVVTRRFHALELLARNQREEGQLDEAAATFIETAALAKGPLSEFPEFLVRANLEIARVYILQNEPSSAKSFVAEATNIAKQNGDIYMITMAGFATGLLFAGVGRHREAQNILTGAAARLSPPLSPEQALLKADMLLQMSHELNIIEAIDEAARTYCEAIDFLIEHGKAALDQGHTSDAFKFLMTANRHADLLPRTETNVSTIADLHITTARLLDIKGYWSKALELLDRALEIFNATGHLNKDLYIAAQLSAGDLLIKQKEYGKAAALLEKAKTACEEQDDLFNLAVCFYHQGVGLSKSGKDDKGLALFDEALGILKNMEKSHAVRTAHALNNNQISFITAKNKEYDRALDCLDESVELLRDEPNDPALAEAYRMQGEIFCERRQNIQSERALKKALAIFEKRGAAYEMARAYKSLGENCLASGDLDMANFFFEESIRILEDLNIESDLPMLYSAKARICIMQEDFATAEKFFYKDFEIAKKSDNMHSLAFSYFYIGRVRRLLKRAHSAEDFLKRSLELFQKVNNQIMAGHAMLELALCAMVRLDFKHAMENCDRTKGIFEQSRNPDLVARLLQVRGMVLRDSRDQRRRVVAQRNFEDAIRILEKSSRVSIELAELHYEFAMFWKEGKDRRRAVEHLIQALELCEKLGLAQKVNTYLNTLQQISPEDGAKLRMGRLVDKAAVEQITKGGSSEGITVERKNLSILFTDIRGFTTISETLSLDMMTSFLNDFYYAVTQAMIKCRGRINKFIGDAVLAIFNIDGDLDDHPVWAVRAAFELVHTVNEINLIRGKRGEIDIQVGVGVTTGEVLIGSFGSMLRQDYTAIGDTVNTASRLQGQAGPGEIIVSQFVYDHVKDIVEAEDLGEKPLKGKGQPLRLWKILKIKE